MLTFFKKLLSNIKQRLKRLIPFFIILILIVLLTLGFLWRDIVITIKSGEAGVMYYLFFGGTVTDKVIPEGIHIIAPWDNITIYTVRIQTTLHEFTVLTNRGLPITLELAIRFRPEYEVLGLLHQQVGPDYFNTIIIPEVESVLRKNIGHYNPEEIYINKDNVLTEIIVEALEALGQKYVEITDVIIRSVILPDEIQSAIKNKLIDEQQYEAYEFKLKREEQEAERKRIEAKGIHDYHETIAKTLDNKMLRWRGIEATLKLSESNNSKVIVVGGTGTDGLPLIGNFPLIAPEKIPEKKLEKVPEKP